MSRVVWTATTSVIQHDKENSITYYSYRYVGIKRAKWSAFGEKKSTYYLITDKTTRMLFS